MHLKLPPLFSSSPTLPFLPLRCLFMYGSFSWRDSDGGGGGNGTSWLSASGWGSGWGDELQQPQQQQQQQSSFLTGFSGWGWDNPAVTSSLAACDAERDAEMEPRSEPAATAAAEAPRIAHMQLRASAPSKFKPLTKLSKSTAISDPSNIELAPSGSAQSSVAGAPATAAATAPVPPLLKPVRFLKSKHLLGADPVDSANGSTGATAPEVLKTGSRVALLTRVPPPPSCTSAPSAKAEASARNAPLLLKTKAMSSTSSAAVLQQSSSTAVLELALVYIVTYSLAGRKKRQHREGYLHLFRSTLPSAAHPAADTSATSRAPTGSSVTAEIVASPASFLKSHLYSECGLLLDEQLGRDVTCFEPAPPKAKRQRGAGDNFGFGGSLWNMPSTKRSSAYRREDEVSDNDSDDSEEEESSLLPALPSFGDFTTPAAAAASTKPALQSNLFTSGETVTLGRFEVALEDVISKAEFDRKTKISSQPARGTHGGTSRNARQSSPADCL